jgi:exopolysaccharide production protein ExoZ
MLIRINPREFYAGDKHVHMYDRLLRSLYCAIPARALLNWVRQTFELSSSRHDTVQSMEGLRGFAVFLVFLVHYFTLIEPWVASESITFQLGEYLRNIGNAGVDLFFVLSGYLIYGTLILKHKPFKSYITRRVLRIYPTFLVVFSIYLLASVATPSESKLPHSGAALGVYVMQNLLLMPGLFDIVPVITVAWSLSYECFFYLLIPFLISILFIRSWPRHRRIGFFICLSIAGFVYFYFRGGHIRLLMFVSGILVYETLQSGLLKPLPLSGIISLVVACIVMVIVPEYHASGWWRFLALYILFFGLCVECFKVSSSFTCKVFSFPPLRWFGNMSYSYFLIHGLALKAAFSLVTHFTPPHGTGTAVSWLLLPPMFLISVVPAAFLFIVIEKPYSLGVKVKAT